MSNCNICRVCRQSFFQCDDPLLGVLLTNASLTKKSQGFGNTGCYAFEINHSILRQTEMGTFE